jgi:hypothetical protein
LETEEYVTSSGDDAAASDRLFGNMKTQLRWLPDCRAMMLNVRQNVESQRGVEIKASPGSAAPWAPAQLLCLCFAAALAWLVHTASWAGQTPSTLGTKTPTTVQRQPQHQHGRLQVGSVSTVLTSFDRTNAKPAAPSKALSRPQTHVLKKGKP